MSEFSRAKHHEFGFPREMSVLPYFLPDPDPVPREALPRYLELIGEARARRAAGHR